MMDNMKRRFRLLAPLLFALLSPAPAQAQKATAYADLARANSVSACIAKLAGPGWCEVAIDASTAFRRKDVDWVGDWGVVGPRAAWTAWNGSAVNYPKMWLHGGGHGDSGMIDVYEVDLEKGSIERIYTPPRWNALWWSEQSQKFARRHAPELPVSTHTYDGFTYDPESGLLILVTGFPYTGGLFEITENNRATQPLGTGVYAFNPSDAAIKGIPPRSWRRLSDRDIGGSYPRSEYHQGLVLGSNTKLYSAHWEGNELVISPFHFFENPNDWPGVAHSHGDTLYLRHKRNLWGYRHGRKYQLKLATPSPASHGTSLAFYRDNPIYWDGHNRVLTQDLESGDWRVFPWQLPEGNTGKVFSKWFKHPEHADIFIGWSTARTGPLVYRHGGESYSISTASLQPYIDKGRAIPPGNYLESLDLKKPTEVDLRGVNILGHSGNGYVVARGGPHRISNLSVSQPGRSGIWAQNTPRVTLENFHIANQHFGVITANNGGELHLRNGVIEDGRGSEFGQQHNVYAGEIDKVTVDGLHSLRHHHGGHLFKSRAPYNLIENSNFDGDNSRHSRILDFPCGGHVEIRNSRMLQSPQSDNRDLIAIAVESCRLPQSTLVLENTHWEARVPRARFLTSKEAVDIECRGENTFVGVPDPCN